MIEINLLPDELKKRKRIQPGAAVSAIDLQKLPFKEIAFIAVGGFIVIQIILFAVGSFCSARCSGLDKEYKEILPKKIESEKLRIQLDKMSKKVSAIDELMVKRFSWAKKLNDLSDSMTPGIWLTGLEYDEKLEEIIKEAPAGSPKTRTAQPGKTETEKILQRYLIISGTASSMGDEGTALIGRFIKSLRENPGFYSDFSDIQLGTIKREKAEDQEVMTFKITCLFKK